jgi:ATP-dependent DNA helicase RecG
MSSERNMQDILHRLLAMPVESEVVEFKEAKNSFDFDVIGKYFSALANEANLKGDAVAWLVFGIHNKGEIVGSSFRAQPKKLTSLKQEISNHMTHGISFVDIHELRENGKRILLFEIPAAPRSTPVAFKGHWYGRNGESLVPLNIEKLGRILLQAMVNDWSAEIVADASLDDLDPAAMLLARENFKKKNPRLADDVGAWDDAAFLQNAKLSIRGKLTRAAILLLGKNQSEFFLGGNTKIRWVLKDYAGNDKDYEIFGLPWLLAVDKVFMRIRNVKYRYMQQGTVFPQEMDTYDPLSIREALNNCIAHQDYRLAGRINVIEHEDDLRFTNLGSFLPGDVQQFLMEDTPPERYRNHFLVEAMRNLNLVDTVGGGVRKMFLAQRERLFPLPEYDFTRDRVSVTLVGKVLDLDYANTLAANKDLNLFEIMALDKVQKRKPLNEDEEKQLKKKHLIEGRKPNYFIAKSVAQKTGQKAEYTKNSPYPKQHLVSLIQKLLTDHNAASRQDIDKLLWNMLPDWMTEQQKKAKIGNIINEMRAIKIIHNNGTRGKPCWVLSEASKNWQKL